MVPPKRVSFASAIAVFAAACFQGGVVHALPIFGSDAAIFAGPRLPDSRIAQPLHPLLQPPPFLPYSLPSSSSARRRTDDLAPTDDGHVSSAPSSMHLRSWEGLPKEKLGISSLLGELGGELLRGDRKRMRRATAVKKPMAGPIDQSSIINAPIFRTTPRPGRRRCPPGSNMDMSGRCRDAFG